MSFNIGGALSSVAGGALSGAISSFLGNDDMNLSPIPAFFFEVDCYEPDGGVGGLMNAVGDTIGLDMDSTAGQLASAAVGMAADMAMGALTSFLDPGSWNVEKSFIEVTGLDIGLEGKRTFNEGGNNYPIDLPDKMKNTAITLKRLIRPAILQDKWTTWYKQTFAAIANWEERIHPKIVQVCIMHPNKGMTSATILATIDFYNAYPSKVNWTTLNSTSEELLVEEIEISYAHADMGMTSSMGGLLGAAGGALGGLLGGSAGASIGASIGGSIGGSIGF